MSVEFDQIHSLPPEELGADSLLDTNLRVWAEIGRTKLPAASVVGMAEGTIVDLDCEPSDPAELYVNGRFFGIGKLILVDGEWAFRVESLADSPPQPDGDDPVEHVSRSAQDEPDSDD